MYTTIVNSQTVDTPVSAEYDLDKPKNYSLERPNSVEFQMTPQKLPFFTPAAEPAPFLEHPVSLEWQLCIFSTVFRLLSWRKNFLSTGVSFDLTRSL